MAGESERIVTLATIAGGAAHDRFEEALVAVLANIADPNTEPEKTRKIVLTVAMRPNKNRDACEVIVSSEAKLAPVKPADSTLFIGKHAGRRVAFEYDPKQAGLFDQPRPKVVDIRTGDAASEEGPK